MSVFFLLEKKQNQHIVLFLTSQQKTIQPLPYKSPAICLRRRSSSGRHFRLDPIDKMDDAGVNAGVFGSGTADTPRHQAQQLEPAVAFHVAHQRSSGVALLVRGNETKKNEIEPAAKKEENKKRHTRTWQLSMPPSAYPAQICDASMRVLGSPTWA